jgi:hypothetical protein
VRALGSAPSLALDLPFDKTETEVQNEYPPAQPQHPEHRVHAALLGRITLALAALGKIGED